jgi:hypothetical protein
MATFNALRYFPLSKLTLLEWQVYGACGVIIIGLVLISIPLSVGLFLRRRWARHLLIAFYAFSLVDVVYKYWSYGPFSPENSLPKVMGSVCGVFLGVGISLSPLFRRYMNREGGRFWCKIGVIWMMVSLLFAGAIFYSWNRDSLEPSVQIISLPNGDDASFPVTWDQVPLHGFMIPVPAGTTDDFQLYDDGVGMDRFGKKNDDGTISFMIMSDQEPLHAVLPEVLGINTLERDFFHRYKQRTLVSAIFERQVTGTTHAGFHSSEGFDLMFELKEEDRGHAIEVNLELKPSRKCYLIMIHSSDSMSLDAKLALISSIRSVR